MGLFWNLIQQAQIDKQDEKSKGLEERVEYLEKELRRTQDLLYKTLMVLEEYSQEDIDGDGKIGQRD